MGASCPWNLSTVPILAPGSRSLSSKTWALYGAMIRMSSRRDRELRLRADQTRSSQSRGFPPPARRSGRPPRAKSFGCLRAGPEGISIRRREILPFDLIRCCSSPGKGMQTAFIEKFGGEGADIRVQTPGLLQEQPAIRRNRRVWPRGCDRAPRRPSRPDGCPASAVRAAADLPAARCSSPACDTARTLASDICAASSTNRTSSVSNASGLAQSHAVPAAA